MDPGASGISPAIEPASDVLDVDVLQDLLASLTQPLAVAAVYRKFVENAAEFIREIPNQDHAARIETLHTLKGSAAMMGAKCLARLAARLQTEAETSSVQVAQTMQALTEELEKFRRVAAIRLADHGAPPV
jgi:HPt (histidine-containing phosphotransfer) domain-containing protein